MSEKDHEVVSIYPLEPDVLEKLLVTQGECVFNWCTRDNWPVGVIMSYVWHDGRIWVTAGAHRHRIAAVRRNPQVSVVVTSTGTSLGPAKTATVKGRAIIHEDRETKDWFYHALAGRGGDTPEVRAFEERLDSPLRVIIEVVPVKWITFDGIKFGMDTAGQLPESQRGPMLSSDRDRLPGELKARGMA